MVKCIDILLRVIFLIAFVMFDRYLFRYILNLETTPARFVPQEWISGRWGFFFVIGLVIAFVITCFVLYELAQKALHRFGGRFAHLIDRDR